MIQRIQSLFLVLLSGSFWAMLGLPYANSDNATDLFLSDMEYDFNDHILLLILILAGGIITLISVFLYRNRKLQVRITYLGLLLAILLPAAIILLFIEEYNKNHTLIDIDWNYGLLIPAVGVIAALLAIRFIKKDDKIVQSMDRLR